MANNQNLIIKDPTMNGSIIALRKDTLKFKYRESLYGIPILV
jgi:hypothetical protein